MNFLFQFYWKCCEDKLLVANRLSSVSIHWLPLHAMQLLNNIRWMSSSLNQLCFTDRVYIKKITSTKDYFMGIFACPMFSACLSSPLNLPGHFYRLRHCHWFSNCLIWFWFFFSHNWLSSFNYHYISEWLTKVNSRFQSNPKYRIGFFCLIYLNLMSFVNQLLE